MLLSCNEAKLKSIPKEELSKKSMEIDTMRVKQFIVNSKEHFLVKTDQLPNRFFKSNTYSYRKEILLESEELRNAITINFIEYKTEKKFEKEMNFFLKNLGDIEKVIWNKDRKYIKSQPIFAVFNSRSIILMNYKCENVLDKRIIESVQAKLLKLFSIKNATTMDISCGGPLKWN